MLSYYVKHQRKAWVSANGGLKARPMGASDNMQSPLIYSSLLPASHKLAEVAEHERSDHHLTERHLQCIWSDERLRPTDLTNDLGEAVEVIDPGRWNLEAGPDFIDATLLVGPERRRLVGDVEIHIHPRAWHQHGHADDPNYARVVAHVTYLPAARTADTLPAAMLRISLRDPLQQQTAFRFDDIDLAAYPHGVIPATPRPCAQALGDDPTRQSELLYAAGLHRMARKEQRMAALIGRLQDPQQAFYESFMAALGHKLNTRNSRRLAQLVPLAAWPGELDAETHYARLLAAAGLLPQPERADDATSQALLRRLWDSAWRYPVPTPDPPLTWRLGALRPANHPARRLAIAAALFGNHPIERLWQEIAVDPPEQWFKTLRHNLITAARLPCWEDRLTLQRPATSRPPLLLGNNTANMLITNVIIPYLNHTTPATKSLLTALPPETVSSPMRTTAVHLLGRDHNPALYSNSGLLQQGLLQIYADFCLNAQNGCRNCNLAAALKAN